ncbi:MAG: carboxy terminal-processing peptidase, partial [Alcanivorax sp.]
QDLVPLLPGLRERHDARIGDNPEFVYVNQLRDLLNRANERQELSLNAKQRKAWQEDFDQRRLDIENALRKHRGEEPIEKMEDLRALEEQRALDPDSNDEPLDEDPYLRETGHILADMVSLLREQRVADERAS